MIREEKVSGASRDGRSELAILLDFIRPGDTLIVTKLDRLARNTIDMLTIITDLGSRGVTFISLAEPWANTDNPASKLMLTVMSGVATFERERIKERQREGIAKAKAAGKYKGRKPLSDEIVSKIVAMHADERRPTYISKMLKVGRTSVYRTLSAKGLI
jgi:DNA invertase Pin-like site-specific DNA recombinase